MNLSNTIWVVSGKNLVWLKNGSATFLWHNFQPLSWVWGHMTSVASFTKEVNLRLAKRPLKTNGRLANCGLTFLVKVATGSHLGFVVMSHPIAILHGDWKWHHQKSEKWCHRKGPPPPHRGTKSSPRTTYVRQPVSKRKSLSSGLFNQYR